MIEILEVWFFRTPNNAFRNRQVYVVPRFLVRKVSMYTFLALIKIVRSN